MPPALRYSAALVAPLLISKLVELLLGTRAGQTIVANTMGQAAAETGRGAQVFSHYSKLISGLLIVAVNRWQDSTGDETLSQRLRRVDGLGWLRYISEVLLGFGVLLRTASELFEETARLRTGRGLSRQ